MRQIFIDIHTHRPSSSGVDLFAVYNHILNGDSNNQDFSFLPPVTAGLHPWHIQEEDPFKGISFLEELLASDDLLAVGECGLDKVIHVPLVIQQEVFQKQIRLAQQYAKPLIIHCVRAFEEVLVTLKNEKFTGHSIFHGFNKNKDLADQLIRKGYYLSFGASMLTGKLDEILTTIPLEQLFFETDDVAMDIKQLYTYTAQLKKISLNELKENIIKNYQLVFE